MKGFGLSLFAVCVLTKILVLSDRNVPVSWEVPIAYVWQDAMIALLLGGLEWMTRKRPWIAGSTYGLALVYLAINVPLTRALSSPFTWQMAQATGGALADSIRHYLTWSNLALLAGVIITGAILPPLMRRISPRIQRVAVLCGVTLIALGPWAARGVDSAGLERNVFVAFVTSTLPRVPLSQEEMDWRASPTAHLPRGVVTNLTNVINVTNAESTLRQLQGAGTGWNVVMIVLESTRARSLQPYGAAEDPMPNLTRLASKALLFENVYAVSPESIKGLFSVLCSRYPAFDTGPAAWERVGTPSIAQVLAEAGYHTGLFHSGRFMYLGMESVIRGRGFGVLEDAGTIGGNVQSSFGVDEPATVQRALSWIDSRPRSRPFFLTYLPIAGHHPYATPEPGPFAGTDDASQYHNALHYADAAVGELWQGLVQRDLAGQTLLIIFGDHGEAFGEHDGNYGHTQFLFEENVHVPCFIIAPGLIHESRRVGQVASLLDIAPTVLDLVGRPIPADYQGSSLLTSAEQERMALFYTDYSLPLVGLRDGPWKFIHEIGSSRGKLFNLLEDPAEEVNLASRQPDRVRAYRDRLRRWSQAQKGRLELAYH